MHQLSIQQIHKVDIRNNVADADRKYKKAEYSVIFDLPNEFP